MKRALLLLIALVGCQKQEEGVWQGYVEGEYVLLASPYAGQLQKLFVRRGDQIGSPAVCRNTQHRERILHSPRAIVKTVKKMAMNVDHFPATCPGPHTIRPGFAPVTSPLWTTATPLTNTSLIPVEI